MKREVVTDKEAMEFALLYDNLTHEQRVRVRRLYMKLRNGNQERVNRYCELVNSGQISAEQLYNLL